MNPPIAKAFVAVSEMAYRLGARKINQLPGCWEKQIDERWWVALNPHREPIKCSHGVEVQPFDCYVEYNGFPAGSFNAAGGFLAAGEAANEQSFIEACDNMAREVEA